MQAASSTVYIYNYLRMLHKSSPELLGRIISSNCFYVNYLQQLKNIFLFFFHQNWSERYQSDDTKSENIFNLKQAYTADFFENDEVSLLKQSQKYIKYLSPPPQRAQRFASHPQCTGHAASTDIYDFSAAALAVATTQPGKGRGRKKETIIMGWDMPPIPRQCIRTRRTLPSHRHA